MIRLDNSSFHTKVWDVQGGREVCEALGRVQHECFSSVGGGSRSPYISQRCAQRECVEWL